MSTTAHSNAKLAPASVGSLSVWRRFANAVNNFNVLTGYLSAIVIVISSVIIVYGVVMRYAFKTPVDWGLELSVFLLIIATFMSAAFTQLQRGHVSIEVLAHVLPSRINRWRHLVGDVLSLMFCLFVAWNAWWFFHEAFEDGRVTNSAWGPKLWVPYLFMATGLTALSLQLIVQIVDALGSRHRRAKGSTQ